MLDVVVVVWVVVVEVLVAEVLVTVVFWGAGVGATWVVTGGAWVVTCGAVTGGAWVVTGGVVDGDAVAADAWGLVAGGVLWWTEAFFWRCRRSGSGLFFFATDVLTGLAAG